MQGRRQLVLRHEGKSVPGTVLQRALEGLLHVRQCGKNQVDLLLQGFLFRFLQAPRNRKVILSASRRRLPRCHDQCHRFVQVARLAIPECLHPLGELVERELTLVLQKDLAHLIGG